MAMLTTPLQLLASTPPVTRVFTGLTVAFSLLYFWLSWSGQSTPYLTIIPGSSLFYPWTLVTSVFVETNIVEVRVLYIQSSRSASYLNTSTAHRLFDCRSSIIEISGEAMGYYGDHQVYRLPAPGFKHRRSCVQLDRVFPYAERRALPVSTRHNYCVGTLINPGTR
jgi:hypothetical protein